MDYDTDKIDEITLALLFMNLHDQTQYGARAWKGFDWDTLNRLHEKGFIDNPINKNKSVFLSKEACKKAEELFKKYFEK